MRPAAIITGGSRGIGAACARLLAQSGYDVAIAYAKDENAAAGVCDECRNAGARSIAIQCDISHEEDILRLFDTAEQELGHIRAICTGRLVTD